MHVECWSHLKAASVFPKVKRLYRRFEDSLRWYVPLGLKSWFTARSIKNVVELDWWEEIEDMPTGLKVTFTPCQHWSARSAWDRKKSLWGSYLVQGQAGKVLKTIREWSNYVDACPFPSIQ